MLSVLGAHAGQPFCLLALEANMVTGVVSAIAFLLVAGAPTSTAPPASAPNTNVGDPNEKICETIKMIGSRLATKRFCGTRAEWADRKLQDKQALEKAQMGPCVRSGGC
jgi:hypothetical protein